MEDSTHIYFDLKSKTTRFVIIVEQQKKTLTIGYMTALTLTPKEMKWFRALKRQGLKGQSRTNIL
jgi:hypothetical protein